MRILMITSEWPTPENPSWGSFIVRQVDYLRRAGVEVEVFPLRGGRRPGNYWRAFLALRRLVRSNRFDVVHAQFGHSGALAQLVSRSPTVVTFHGSDVLGIVRPDGQYAFSSHILRALSRFAARRADEAVIVARHLRRLLPPRHYHVVPCGINLDLFQLMPKAEARAALGLDPYAPLVLFGGNTRAPVKRYELAQAAIAEVQLSLPARLVVMEGEPQERVPLYMNACDVLLLTSRHEGSPNVIREALACNLPIVSVPVGDVTERLQHVAGCVVTQDDSTAALTAALLPILKAPARINGRPHVLDLDEHRTVSDLIGIYQLARASYKST